MLTDLWYARYLRTGPWQPPSESMERSLLAGIDFTTTFQDEDKLVEGMTFSVPLPTHAQSWPITVILLIC